MRHYPILILLLAVALSATLASCDDRVAASAFCGLPQAEWDSEDTLVFPVDSLHVGGRYAVTLSLRLSVARPYPYHDVSLAVRRELPGDTLTDTLNLPLTEGRSDMAGKGVSFYLYDFPIDTLNLPAGARGRYAVNHIMRRSPLPGIRDVGITLRRLSPADAYRR